MCYFICSDESRYRELHENLKHNVFCGCNEYLTTVSNAYELLLRTSRQIGYRMGVPMILETTLFWPRKAKEMRETAGITISGISCLAEMELFTRVYNAMHAIHITVTWISAPGSQEEVLCK